MSRIAVATSVSKVLTLTEGIMKEIIPPEYFEGKMEGLAYRVEEANGVRTYILMCEMILERMGKPRPSPEHRLCYKNGNVLDNQRNNLEWRIPGSENFN